MKVNLEKTNFLVISSLIAFITGFILSIYLIIYSINDFIIWSLDILLLVYGLIIHNSNPFFKFLQSKGGRDYDATNHLDQVSVLEVNIPEIKRK